MADKTKKQVKKKVVKVRPIESVQLDEPEPIDIAVDEVYNRALSGGLTNNSDRMAVSRALTVLRTMEMKTESTVECAIHNAYKECREKIFKVVLESVLKNNLRFIDVAIIMEMLYTESNILSVWEYENLDDADIIMATVNEEDLIDGKKPFGITSMELLNCLGGEDIGGDEEDDSDQ
jgi:hypothetical protein